MIILQKNQFAQYYIKKAQRAEANTVRRMSIAQAEKSLIESTTEAKPLNKTENNESAKSIDIEKGKFKAFVAMLVSSFKFSWYFLVPEIYIFFITFVVFPGTTDDTTLQFMEGIKNYDSWFGLVMTLIFNFFDTLGRFLAGVPFFMIGDKATVAISYCRTIFIVTFFLIAFNVAPDWLFGVNADWFKMINMILFSFTNGYGSTLLAIKAPSRAPDEKKEQVGLFIGMSITTGILLGSLVAIGIGHLDPSTPIS